MNLDPIIVGGFYRSGTSLVRRLLDAHSMIHCPPEVKLWRDLEQDFKDDPFSHLRLAKTLEVLPVPAAQRFSVFGKAYIELRETSLDVLHKQVWADKDPENARYLTYWQNVMGRNFRYIHVARHPLDTLASCIEAKFVKTLPNDPKLILAIWQHNCGAFQQFYMQCPSQCYVLHYEQLVAQPTVALQKLFSWLNLPFEPAVLKLFSSQERGAGIEDIKVAQTHQVHQHSVARWKESFTKVQADELMQPIAECYQWLATTV